MLAFAWELTKATIVLPQGHGRSGHLLRDGAARRARGFFFFFFFFFFFITLGLELSDTKVYEP